MERRMLSTLDFNLGHPGSYSFLRKIANKLGIPRKSLVFMTAQYVQEPALKDYQLACVLPSKLALAGLTFAHMVHNGQEDADSKMWRAEIEKHFQCQWAQIYRTVRELAKLVLADVANLILNPIKRQ